MSSPARLTHPKAASPPRARLDDMPILYEDEEEGDMGESSPHMDAEMILFVALRTLLASRKEYRVFANMNLYYRQEPRHPKTGSWPYVSPDVMVVRPRVSLPDDFTSYEIGRDGPAPVLVAEMLSPRSAQQRDLDLKVILYSMLSVAEYILVDPSGKYLPQKLLLKRLQADGTWNDEQDPDSGITSGMGFRLLFDSDGRLQVIDGKTGEPLLKPDKAQEAFRAERDARQEAEASQQAAEARVRELEAELQQLRAKPGKKKRDQGKQK